MVKFNQQAAPTPEAYAAIKLIEKAVLACPVFRSAAQPAAIARILLNRHAMGMEYGSHVDAPFIDGVRTDLSFTLFLSEPDTYEGGSLVIDSAGTEDAVKPLAGTLVLYPSTCLHRVEKVTRGERLAAVGWVKSLIRSSDHRALAFELDRLAADFDTFGAPEDLQVRLVNLRNNLLRALSD